MKDDQKNLILIIAVLAILFFLGNFSLNKLYSKDVDSSTYHWVDVEKNQSKEKADILKNDQLLFLLAGVDKSASQDTSSYDATRSDTMMLVKANFKTGEICLISLPRDSFVQVNDQYTKLTHAHAYGGMDLTMETIRKWLNLDLDYYVEINFDAVKTIVDSMGGVEYEIPDNGIEYRVADTKGNWKTLEPGKQKLNGEDALAFLRFRSGYATGDIGRIHAQQDFMKSFANQFLSQSKIKQAPAMVQLVVNDVNTNIPFHELSSLLGKIEVFKEAKLETYIIPGDGRYFQSVAYFIPYPKKTNKLIQEELSDFCFEAPYNQKEIDDLNYRFGPMEEELEEGGEENSAQDSQR